MTMQRTRGGGGSALVHYTDWLCRKKKSTQKFGGTSNFFTRKQNSIRGLWGEGS